VLVGVEWQQLDVEHGRQFSEASSADSIELPAPVDRELCIPGQFLKDGRAESIVERAAARKARLDLEMQRIRLCRVVDVETSKVRGCLEPSKLNDRISMFCSLERFLQEVDQREEETRSHRSG
jgi:hypothetical protein